MTEPEYAALGAHWYFLHPLVGEEVVIWGDAVEALGIEEFTKLPVVRKKRVSKTIMVKGIVEPMKPLCVIVDDDGVFRACYDERELEADTMVLSKKKLSFDKQKWILEVYEEFSNLPEAVLVGGEKVRMPFIWRDHSQPCLPDSFKHKKETFTFPCPVYRDTGDFVTQPNLPLNGKWSNGSWEYDDTHPWKQNYNVGPRGWTFLSVVRKATCGYESTEDYLQANLGLKLHHSDREWYVGDKRVIESGLPAEQTLDVLSELVHPYGVEIAEVYTDPAVWYEEFDAWAQKLGKEDELYQVMQQAGANLPTPRWHIGPPPEKIALVSMSGGGGGGHASYLAPRSPRPAVYQMAVTFRRIK